jgi:hypothetical protein
MGRGPKPGKSKAEAKPPVARKSSKNGAARVSDLEKRLAEALRDKAEAQEQQAATAEILRVISQSLTDVQPVFDMIAANAVRLCVSRDAQVFLRHEDLLRQVSHHLPARSDRSTVESGGRAGRCEQADQAASGVVGPG